MSDGRCWFSPLSPTSAGHGSVNNQTVIYLNPAGLWHSAACDIFWGQKPEQKKTLTSEKRWKRAERQQRWDFQVPRKQQTSRRVSLLFLDAGDEERVAYLWRSVLCGWRHVLQRGGPVDRITISAPETGLSFGKTNVLLFVFGRNNLCFLRGILRSSRETDRSIDGGMKFIIWSTTRPQFTADVTHQHPNKQELLSHRRLKTPCSFSGQILRFKYIFSGTHKEPIGSGLKNNLRSIPPEC